MPALELLNKLLSKDLLISGSAFLKIAPQGGWYRYLVVSQRPAHFGEPPDAHRERQQSFRDAKLRRESKSAACCNDSQPAKQRGLARSGIPEDDRVPVLPEDFAKRHALRAGYFGTMHLT